MRFQLAHLLALIPFVAGMALPEPASNAAALAALPSHTTVTLADGSTCLAVALYYQTFYANSAGVPGCGVQRLNRVSFEPFLSVFSISLGQGRHGEHVRGYVCANNEVFCSAAGYRLEWRDVCCAGLWVGLVPLAGRKLGVLLCRTERLPDKLLDLRQVQYQRSKSVGRLLLRTFRFRGGKGEKLNVLF